MPEQVRILGASAEYRAWFDRPYVGLIADAKPRIVEAVVAALSPFGFRLANAEIVTNGPLSEQKAVFRIPERGISFQFGAEDYRFGKEELSWANVDADAVVLAAAECAVLDGIGATIESSRLTVAAHLQPLAKAREEILAPFMPEPFRKLLLDRKAQTFGNHLTWAGGGVLVDFSAVFANGIFLRLTSEFKGQRSLTEIRTRVRHEQEVLFEILGVEEVGNA